MAGVRILRNKTILIVMAAIISLVPLLNLERHWMLILTQLGIYAILTLSLDLLTGYSGQISLGHNAFYAVGAYTSGFLTAKLGFSFPVSISIAVLTGVVFGLILAYPAIRSSGFFLAMITIAFAVFIETGLWRLEDLTGGVDGLNGIPTPVLGTLKLFDWVISDTMFYYVVWISVAICGWVITNLVRSYIGRSWLAVSGSELVAATLGVNVKRYKYLAFIISTGMAAFAGALYAHKSGYINPQGFTINLAVLALTMTIVGGMRSVIGALFGAAIFTFLPQYLYILKEYEALADGLILVFFVLFMPKGLAGIIFPREVKDSSGVEAKESLSGDFSKTHMLNHTQDKGEIQEVVIGSIKKLTKNFGGTTALHEVSLDIYKGKIHALIGPNGSGKTTLINTISGIYKPSEGEVRFEDNVINGLPLHEISDFGITRTFQNLMILGELTVLENVLVGAHREFKSGFWSTLINLPRCRKEEDEFTEEALEILELVGLKDKANELASTLPYGSQKMLELARAVASKPKILLLDEPAAGLIDDEVDFLEDVILKINAQGYTIVIIEHHLDMVLRLANHVTVLNYGEVIFQGSPDAARNDNQVKEVYIGGQHITA